MEGVAIFSIDAVDRVRTECHDHVHTPYPSMSRLLNYPFSVPPLRAFAGWLDDQPGTPAHCAALSARILRSAVPEISLPHASHWFGPSSLYLELSTPERMERALATQRPVGRSKAEEEQDKRAGGEDGGAAEAAPSMSSGLAALGGMPGAAASPSTR